MTIDAVRSVADAVLYEGYLLYPYRASSAKNRSRWQFGVLGPPNAAPAAFGEAPDMAMQCLLTDGGTVRIHLRFLHVQVRQVQRLDQHPVRAEVGGEQLRLGQPLVAMAKNFVEASGHKLMPPVGHARPMSQGLVSNSLIMQELDEKGEALPQAYM